MDPNQVLRLIEQAAVMAVNDLRMLFTDESYWDNGEINQNKYGKLDRAKRHFINSRHAIESSRADVELPIEAQTLFNLLIDREIWNELFSIVVSYSNTIYVVPPGVQVMEERHVLSPLMAPRRFKIIRCCQMVGEGLWVVADVSDTTPNSYNIVQNSGFYRRPSGCLIEALPANRSKVTWIHHVEVRSIDSKHKQLQKLGSGYGAKRWVVTLERMLERRQIASTLTLPPAISQDLQIEEPGKNLMLFGRKLLRTTFHGKSMMDNLPDVRDIFQKMTIYQQPGSTVATWAEPFLVIDFSPDQALRFLLTHRQLWDPLIGTGTEILRIVTGPNDINHLTIRQKNADMTMLVQECYLDACGGIIAYSPLDMSFCLQPVYTGIHPSLGIIISGDGQSARSLITVVSHVDVGLDAEIRQKTISDFEVAFSRTSRDIQGVFGVMEE